MLLSDEHEDEQKRAWNGNGQHSNGSQHAAAYTASLLAEEEKHDKQHAATAGLPHSTPQSLELSSDSLYSAVPPCPSLPVLGVPAVHRPFVFLLCLCSFFATFRPSEPFLTPYLIDYKGLGADAVNERVYPTWTYSYFAFLLPAGVMGEVVGYRPMIVAQLLALLATYVMLIWAEGLQWMQFMQVTYGFASAVQSCVFFTYIYRCSPVEIYPTVVRHRQRQSLQQRRRRAGRVVDLVRLGGAEEEHSSDSPLLLSCLCWVVRLLTNALRVSVVTVSCCISNTAHDVPTAACFRS